MEWPVRLKDQVELPGDPKAIGDQVIEEEGRILLIVRLILDGLPELWGGVRVLGCAVRACQ